MCSVYVIIKFFSLFFHTTVVIISIFGMDALQIHCNLLFENGNEEHIILESMR